ncbi:MAG: hypothetical protein WBG02_21125 [Candidatus Acidiferrum sp.]
MSSLPTLFEPAPKSDSSSAFRDYIQPHLGHALRIWWAYFWPTTVISFLLGILLGRVVRLLYENFIASATALAPVIKFGGYVINYVVAFFVFRYLLGKTFRHFKLRLIPSGGDPSSKTLQPTMSRTLRVWWAFTWRSVVYGLLCLAFVLYPMEWFVGIFRPGPTFSMLFFSLLGSAAGGAIALFVIYSNILDEDLGDFRVVLLPREVPAQAGDPLAAMPAEVSQATK